MAATKKTTRKTTRKPRKAKGGAEPAKTRQKAREAKGDPKGAKGETPDPIALRREAGKQVMRVISLPPDLWEKAKSFAYQQDCAARDIIRQALAEQLHLLIMELNNAGFRPDIETKRVRANLDEKIIEQMHEFRDKTGLPGILGMRLALERSLEGLK